MMKMIFGIDFGTTTTGFVAYDPETRRYEEIGNEEGRPFHSVIVIDSLEGEVTHTGTEAWRRRQLLEADAESIVISSVKQKLFSDESWRTATKIWTPEKVAAEVLKTGVQAVKERKAELEFPIEAVIAVPVDFGYEERAKIVEAARLAGINIKQIVSEPTAALVGCGENIGEAQNVLVFDWGGGTLDVSVLKNTQGRVDERGKQGMRA